MEVASTFSLDNILDGAVIEAFGHEFAQVIANIADINNQATSARNVSIKVGIKPNPQRDYATVKITVTSSVNPHSKPMESAILLNRQAEITTVTERYVEQKQLEVE